MGGEGLRGGCGGGPRAIGVMWVGFPGSGVQVYYQSHLVFGRCQVQGPITSSVWVFLY